MIMTRLCSGSSSGRVQVLVMDNNSLMPHAVRRDGGRQEQRQRILRSLKLESCAANSSLQKSFVAHKSSLRRAEQHQMRHLSLEEVLKVALCSWWGALAMMVEWHRHLGWQSRTRAS